MALVGLLGYSMATGNSGQRALGRRGTLSQDTWSQGHLVAGALGHLALGRSTLVYHGIYANGSYAWSLQILYAMLRFNVSRTQSHSYNRKRLFV